MRPKSQRASSSRLAEEARCPLAPAQKMLGMSSYNILEGGGGDRRYATYSCPVFLMTSRMLFSSANFRPAAMSSAEDTLIE